MICILPSRSFVASSFRFVEHHVVADKMLTRIETGLLKRISTNRGELFTSRECRRYDFILGHAVATRHAQLKLFGH